MILTLDYLNFTNFLVMFIYLNLLAEKSKEQIMFEYFPLRLWRIFSLFLLLFVFDFLFQTFDNDVEAGHAQGFSIFSTQNTVADSSDANQVTFEPLPDILAKTVSATALRPRISSLEKEQQRIAAKHISKQKFPHQGSDICDPVLYACGIDYLLYYLVSIQICFY